MVLAFLGSAPVALVLPWRGRAVPKSPRAGPTDRRPTDDLDVRLVRCYDSLAGRDRRLSFQRVLEDGKAHLYLDVNDRMDLTPNAVLTKSGWAPFEITNGPWPKALLPGDTLKLTLTINP